MDIFETWNAVSPGDLKLEVDRDKRRQACVNS
jgi:hypothetical protein